MSRKQGQFFPSISLPTVEEKPQCDKCKFFDELICRRFPPNVSTPGGWLWPITKPHEWCGEFRKIGSVE